MQTGQLVEVERSVDVTEYVDGPIGFVFGLVLTAIAQRIRRRRQKRADERAREMHERVR